ncbi:MAG: hypothetical protein IH626_16265 [Rhodospirillales bacterium]|nr:hypothetical protein [Rhodospirillales bacterium]
MNKRTFTAVAGVLIIVATSAVAEKPIIRNGSKWLDAKVADNMSMMDYAEKNHERLRKAARSWNIDPNASPGRAEWRYNMPDGTIVSCLRGMSGYTFVYDCREY